MSLTQSKLKKDLLAAFNSMTDGDDNVFSKKVSKAVAEYVQAGLVSTVDAGSIPAGAFTGKGTGSISVQSSICENILIAACKTMANMPSGGDAYLATQMASGIHAMISAGEIKTAVTGTAVTPSGVSSPMAGQAKGVMIGVPATIQAGLIATFSTMATMTERGDDYFATQAAAVITAYLKAAIITTNGTGSILGSIGSGTMA